MRFRRARRDASHAAIVAGLRAYGCSVLELHAVGSGCPDLLVGARRGDFLVEVKTPGSAYARKPSGKRQLPTAEKQALFRARWRGHPVAIVTTLNEALAAVGLAPGPNLVTGGSDH